MTYLPLFPLPNVVLFPGVLLPLHVFEPRYRALTADALSADRRIGMVLLRSGWERDYERRPPIHDVGCSGVMVHAVRLDDGRYNIVLRGLERFRILHEDHALPYRRAAIASLPDILPDETDRQALQELRSKLRSRLGLAAHASEDACDSPATRFTAMTDADFVNYLAQYLDLEPIEKQALLERDSLRLRAEGLVELVEMKKLADVSNVPGISH